MVETITLHGDMARTRVVQRFEAGRLQIVYTFTESRVLGALVGGAEFVGRGGVAVSHPLPPPPLLPADSVTGGLAVPPRRRAATTPAK